MPTWEEIKKQRQKEAEERNKPVPSNQNNTSYKPPSAVSPPRPSESNTQKSSRVGQQTYKPIETATPELSAWDKIKQSRGFDPVKDKAEKLVQAKRVELESAYKQDAWKEEHPTRAFIQKIPVIGGLIKGPSDTYDTN